MAARNVSQWRWIGLAIAGVTVLTCTGWSLMQPKTKNSVVRLEGKPGSFKLIRNGKPYFIKGAGGSGSRQLFLEVGGNSTRTWGADDLEPMLDQAHKDGVSVTLGIWLQHNNVFDYTNAAEVKKQFEMCRQAVMRYKDHPALLLWAFGNEMEGSGEDLAVWRAIEDIAAMSKKLDPNHPTMTVVAEIGDSKVRRIQELCPSIDIIGVNSYGGAVSLAERYAKQGGKKPYIVTEFGPPGPWELKSTRWGAGLEPTSSAKARFYEESYQKAVLDNPGNCLGAYAFLWGNKQEATATWFGMLMPGGKPTEAVDVMAKFWTGKPRANQCPRVESLTTSQTDHLQPGQTITAKLSAKDPEGRPLTVKWVLTGEVKQRLSAGRDEVVPEGYPDALVKSDATSAEFRMPKEHGAYRIFAYVFDEAGNTGVANIPIFVDDPNAIKGGGLKVKLPLAIYQDSGENLTFVPSGFMGDTAAFKVDFNSPVQPKVGTRCASFSFEKPDGWAGLVFQYPANDWGELPGAVDLSAAHGLHFWMRGERGGEKVKVECGILKADKKYGDSGTGARELTLTKEWREYTIDLAGQDLSRMKTGFVLVMAGSGSPQKIFLDAAEYR
ncbi:MAG: hypothetical protein JNJ45_11945 [Chthonomonas sp.]|nr:hypothetical protein [Chthonomonas sp.]